MVKTTITVVDRTEVARLVSALYDAIERSGVKAPAAELALLVTYTAVSEGCHQFPQETRPARQALVAREAAAAICQVIDAVDKMTAAQVVAALNQPPPGASGAVN